jgi:hypothetical protein
MRIRCVVTSIGSNATWFGMTFAGGPLLAAHVSFAQNAEDGVDPVADRVVCSMAVSAGGEAIVRPGFLLMQQMLSLRIRHASVL